MSLSKDKKNYSPNSHYQNQTSSQNHNETFRSDRNGYNHLQINMLQPNWNASNNASKEPRTNLYDNYPGPQESPTKRPFTQGASPSFFQSNHAIWSEKLKLAGNSMLKDPSEGLKNDICWPKNPLGDKELLSLLKSTKVSSDTKTKLTKAMSSRDLFQDKEFPHDQGSVIGRTYEEQRELEGKLKPEDFAAWRSYLFYSADNILEKNYSIFKNGIQSKDVLQYLIGDCYLLAALSALAQRPQLIENIFLTKEVNSWGIYVLKIYFNNQWHEVILDSYFPGNGARKTLTTPHENEIWVLLVEKAWAKLHGSYGKIVGGWPETCLKALTGKEASSYDLSRQSNWKRFCDVVSTAQSQSKPMTCCTGGISPEHEQILGIFGNHAYELIGVQKVKIVEDPITFVKLRNPWGRGEWKGPLGENELDSEAIQELGITTEDDGFFVMPLIYFRNYFKNFQVGFAEDR